MVPREHIKERPALLFEFKCKEHGDEAMVKAAAQEALDQIDQKRYHNELAKYHGDKIIAIGIGFSGKHLKMLYR